MEKNKNPQFNVSISPFLSHSMRNWKGYCTGYDCAWDGTDPDLYERERAVDSDFRVGFWEGYSEGSYDKITSRKK